ncbi:hypothetical protein [Bdellovibrio bacteriovorus]|uniref:Uncharacterized protein n=2 Tax=Bdellovibrio bacteriovorus TaxID=959 RepID=Q6MJ79_BDEBA|nr:hypothetical protein [Bdellovibrio bacteriovorus]AHZ85387.1 hypothetical protein EP01_10615 [Bdellovibrio bacteriovorus]ASD62922.1 hypothetical protein B9G79_04735 [Bdellovibrio bacteriovorus]BEV69281.1 hypothetical protein Bb109J_c2701 [Bdellovibrio bacteriovorus]CAE80682.1 hypothetical protein predicted by Glimmer/Critica [Bdellovibrio bacteriovorus HD100]
MKKMMIAMGLLLSAQNVWALTDTKGVPCEARVAQITKAYFNVVDTSNRFDFVVSKKDKIEVTSYDVMTPGSYNQEYIADLVIKFDRSNYRSPEKDQKIRLKLTGEFDCDYLKVRSIKSLGGVERVD